MKLKPCPFCGSTSIEIVQYGKNDYQAFCRNCYVTTAPVLGVEEAEKDWNRRVKQQPYAEEKTLARKGVK